MEFVQEFGLCHDTRLFTISYLLHRSNTIMRLINFHNPIFFICFFTRPISIP
jgi:hypothetical protein